MKLKAFIATNILVTAISILALCCPLPAFAVSTITASSAGDGVFLVQGIGIEDASALEINVQYDTATLANPRVVAGPLIAGAMTAVNPNVPGTVRMVIIRLAPVKGSGVIATMTFDLKGSSPGWITALDARLANINGAPLATLVQINNATETVAVASVSSQSQNTSSGAPVPPANPGTPGIPATMPATIIIAGQPVWSDTGATTPETSRSREHDAQIPAPDGELPPSKALTVIVQTKEQIPVTAVEPRLAMNEKRSIYTQKSILDRFYEYNGVETAAAFIALFGQENVFGYRQEPPVALSDGRSVVKIIFISTPGNRTTSDIAVIGARLISLEKDSNYTNTWVAELMPEKGGYQASISLSQGQVRMIYPLTIAPKVDLDLLRPGAVTEAAFDRYLDQRKTIRSPTFDLNKDGRQDYIDDFTFAVNYLDAVRKARAPGQQAATHEAAP